MKRTETLELLIEIQEAIEHFETRIDNAQKSNASALFSEFAYLFESTRKKNTHNIIIYGMCIGRLNERFTKQLNKLK